MARLNWTDLSIDDLINIAEFISKDSVKYSVIQIKRIRERARLLKAQPLLGRIVPESNDETVRELILGNYRIIYRIVSKDRIDILTIHHSAKILRIDLL
ncbi:MAG: type II toxin-antitoxin system RelE/ParE family toxin [Bacteroidales bacterium]|nr:type II toxin-antitoxin system RelE/ParE family toxin [Bacteroidales bacterium]MCB8999278.1 type II toxin-antitoxin system RelE/ParE family toxin [Bacteroidales bacterium]MCB9013052.1 type II toxin-antitoxin system RelE/ParE family toxin [Bacteroidales bacterium]